MQVKIHKNDRFDNMCFVIKLLVCARTQEFGSTLVQNNIFISIHHVCTFHFFKIILNELTFAIWIVLLERYSPKPADFA